LTIGRGEYNIKILAIFYKMKRALNKWELGFIVYLGYLLGQQSQYDGIHNILSGALELLGIISFFVIILTFIKSKFFSQKK